MPTEKCNAIFLDRDGVINRERGDYVWQLEDFILNDGLIDALKIFKQKNYMLIVITNQGGIDKGLYTHEQVNYLHLHLERTLKNKGIIIDEIYYCPHHPEKTKCLCRKPESLMLEKAIARFNIDASQSYFIGDTDRDMEAGKKAGVNTIRIEANTTLMNVVEKIVSRL